MQENFLLRGKKFFREVNFFLEVKIRSATVDDAEKILKIYSYYVTDTAISFEIKVPTLANFRGRIFRTLKNFPYLVAELDKKIIGYAYAHEFVGREAYKFSAELTIYLDKNFRGLGVGRKLYQELEKILSAQGIKNLYACVGWVDEEDEFLNHNSANFHQHLGFKIVGKFTKCGRKFNRWYDMIWLEKIIGEHN